jgi:hypothetical protein
VVSYKKLKFDGALEVQNVILHGKGVLIFQVEYDAEFMVPNLGK